jgi:hypothetical protein
MNLPCVMFKAYMTQGSRYILNSCFPDDKINKRHLTGIICTETGMVTVYYHPWTGMTIKGGIGTWRLYEEDKK